MTTYPAMELLLQGYLNYDWPDNYATVWEAVDDFAANEPSAVNAASEIDEILCSSPSEDALAILIVGRLGSGYQPTGTESPMRDFLVALQDRLGQRPESGGARRQRGKT